MALKKDEELSKDKTKLLLAIKLFDLQKITLGQAAKMAGFSKRAFMEILGNHHLLLPPAPCLLPSLCDNIFI